MATAVKRYPLDNTHPRSSDHHNARAELFDPYSRRRTQQLLDLTGAHCLEVGYGGGSFADWLATEVGPAGSVLATDIVPMEIPGHPQLTVRQHDIVREPVPGTFDFIHARLVLGHLAEQREVLTKLARALNPGGVLLLEEWWNPVRGDLVVHAPGPEAAALYNEYSLIQAQAIRANGTAPDWARRVHGAMLDDGLVEVHTDVHGEAWPGGSAGARMQQASMAQLRTRMTDLGMTDQLFDAAYALLDDPQLVLLGNLMCSTSGRRS